MAKSGTKHLPPHVRQRLTFRGALLSGPGRFVESVKYKSNSVPKIKPKQARRKPSRRKPSAVTEETQTLKMTDAVTNTTMSKFVRIRYPKKPQKNSIFTAWMKKSRQEAPPSFIVESEREPRELRGILKTESRRQYPKEHEKKSTIMSRMKKSREELSPSFIVESTSIRRELCGILKPKSILKKSGDETITKVIWSGLNRKESNLSKILKKCVKLDKKTISSHFNKVAKKEESLSSLGSKSESEDEPSKHEVSADSIKSASATSAKVEYGLERKSGRCMLEKAPLAQEPPNCGMSSVSNLNVEELLAPPKTKLPHQRIPKDRLYFKNVVQFLKHEP